MTRLGSGGDRQGGVAQAGYCLQDFIFGYPGFIEFHLEALLMVAGFEAQDAGQVVFDALQLHGAGGAVHIRDAEQQSGHGNPIEKR
jgi:hypothetical protein